MWSVAALAALFLLVLGLAILLRPWHLAWPQGPDAMCRVPDAEREAVALLNITRDREAVLRAELARLRDGVSRKVADCKPPPAVPPRQTARLEPPPPAPAPAPKAPVPGPPAVEAPSVPPPEAPPPAPQADTSPAPPRDDVLRLPDDLEQRRDLAFLRGCWVTDPFRHQRGQTVPGISEYCFDEQGRGVLTWRRGRSQCRTRAQAEVANGSNLDIADSDTACSDGSRWYADRLVCQPGPGGVALCSGESFDPVTGRIRWTVRMHRRA